MFQRIIVLLITLAAAVVIGESYFSSSHFLPEPVMKNYPVISETNKEPAPSAGKNSGAGGGYKKTSTSPLIPVKKPTLAPKPPAPEVRNLPVIKDIIFPSVKIGTIPALSDQKINSESIVGLNCFYRQITTGEVFNTGRGSGVIIHPQGYILTARHVVDFKFGLTLGGGTANNFQLANQSVFERCDVGIPRKETVLPDADLIRKVNPSTQLPVLGYTAQIAQPLPSYEQKSYGEMLAMDFAVLRIDGVSADGPTFGIKNLPSSFAYAKVLTERPFPPIGDEILTYGFPGDTTAGKKSAFNTLYLVGSVGKVDKIFSDGFIQTVMEISGGRSGSPLFWKGRVAGIVTSYIVGNRTLSQSLGVGVMLDKIKNFLPGP